MKKQTLLYLILITTFSFCTTVEKSPQAVKHQRVGNAPPDAFVEGSKFPYYGSQDGWNRRYFYEHTKDYYKRRGQRQMLDIVEGKPQEAANYCKKLLAEDPNDLESLYNLVVAQCQLDKVDSAFITMKVAVERGLPFGRFLAGPRKLLAPVTETEAFKAYAAEQSIQLIHGPLIGCLTDQSAKFWVRTRDEVPVQIVASTSDKMTGAIKSDIVKSQAIDDYTAIVELKGLKPKTHYYYDVLLDDMPAIKSDYPSFHTYAPQGESMKFTIGFGGGAGYVPGNERIWDVIHNYKPNAFFFLGDNVYHDLPELTNGMHYYTYYRRQSRPEFRRLVSSAGIYAIWDDHDSAVDDVFMGPYPDRPSWKMPLFHLFRQQWNNPAYGDNEFPGVWFNFNIGDVEFFMLDGRWYRTNTYDLANHPTMLGPVQKAWLYEKVKASTATFKVLVSPVPWSFEAKGDALDTWNGYKTERNEIFDFLAENQIEGVFLLSADRHRSDAWKIERENGYPLYEFMSSRLTNFHVHPLRSKALFGYNEKQSFGLLDFDTTLPDPKATYKIVSIDNEIIHSITIKKSEMLEKQR